ncbi:alpha/beta fold hydrolase [Saccharopolyspora erythraea]|uniref:alpha/beta fold hydrolase n=1 Tax=Saccharopolyspora erythraea TaxID=1836 RepID=UPI0032C22D3C
MARRAARRGVGPGALPLLVTHGWPGTVADFAGIVEPLTAPSDGRDAFDLVIPSLPGFGFSGPTTSTGVNLRRTARAWAELMRRLGYDRYGTQGGDWGAKVHRELALLAPDRVVGMHVNGGVGSPSGDPAEREGLSSRELAALADLDHFLTHRLGYARIQGTRPQTLAYALLDSPTGQLAWNAELLEWFDAHALGENRIDRDQILTNVSIYWFTRTSGAAARVYREAEPDAWGPQQPCAVPTGVAIFAGDRGIRRFAERENNVAHWSEFDRGGHFAALQAPDLLVDDVRAFFRSLR